jgi:2-deoxy-D-gluconate 3-dehydrogenase
MSWGPFDLTGKSAIVTGGAMGIGFGCARRFREAGANVLVADLDLDAAEGARKRLLDLPGEGKVATCQVDVADVDGLEAMIRTCVDELGSFDVLVNNAGIYPMAPLTEITPELIRTVMRVNVEGVILSTAAAARHLVAQGTGGAIINIASMDGFHPTFTGLSTYGASKGAVVSFTKHAALELGPHGIRVNAIAPGSVSTEGAAKVVAASGMAESDVVAAGEAMNARTPLGRTALPDDIATVALFLASDAARYMTGTTVLADGGYLLS